MGQREISSVKGEEGMTRKESTISRKGTQHRKEENSQGGVKKAAGKEGRKSKSDQITERECRGKEKPRDTSG